MIDVRYAIAFNYREARPGRLFALLTMWLVNPVGAGIAIEVDAALDSGAERSLFDGRTLAAIGIELLAGRQTQSVSTLPGMAVGVREHPVHLLHPELGGFVLDVGFSTVPIARNVLGRDFFAHVQIGFRERVAAFYVSPRP